MNAQNQWPADSHGCNGWGGEMARRIAAFDWSCTALGPRETWSRSLNAAVQMLLASPVPLVMLWGRPGTMIYNDAYSVFAGGRHPFLLGRPVEQGWPEIAAFNRHVVDTGLSGGTLSYTDKQLTLHRNGRPEEVWMDLHYSPVAEDDVFEPFYSTKPEGHGTGLGLSMVFGFVRQSSGHVDIETAVGEGTTVVLYFPRTSEAEALEEPASGKRNYSGGETLLVVEDDPDVRLAAIDMLSQLGYRVFSAADGDEALDTLRRGLKIDLLFTDVVMPGTVRSSELAKLASAPPHNAKVIFASGYTRDVIFHEGRLDDGVVLLGKPYIMEDLAKAVRDALDS